MRPLRALGSERLLWFFKGLPLETKNKSTKGWFKRMVIFQEDVVYKGNMGLVSSCLLGLFLSEVMFFLGISMLSIVLFFTPAAYRSKAF